MFRRYLVEKPIDALLAVRWPFSDGLHSIHAKARQLVWELDFAGRAVAIIPA